MVDMFVVKEENEEVLFVYRIDGEVLNRSTVFRKNNDVRLEAIHIKVTRIEVDHTVGID